MRTTRLVTTATLALTALFACSGCSRAREPRTFNTPEEAVRALVDAAKAKDLQQVMSIFGDEGRDLADTSDPVMARQNRDVFIAAAAERWQLATNPGPFPCRS
jgi:hypothetical protein